MADVFKTNVLHHFDAIKLKEALLKEFPQADIRFNLSDNNKTLRIEGRNIPPARVIQIVKHLGFYCELVEE